MEINPLPNLPNQNNSQPKEPAPDSFRASLPPEDILKEARVSETSSPDVPVLDTALEPSQPKPPSMPIGYKDPYQRRSTGRVLAIIGAGAGLLITLSVILGGALLAGRVWDPFWNPFRPDPDKFISSAFLKAAEIKTSHGNIVAKISFEGSETNIVFNGDSDLNNPTSPKILGELGVLMNTPGNVTASAKAGLIIANNEVYFNLEDFSNFEKLSSAETSFSPPFDLTKIKGSWIKAPQSEMSQVSAGEIKNNILLVFKKYKIYNFKKRLSDTKIDEQKIYRYQVAIDNANLEKALVDVFNEALKTQQGSAQIEQYSAFVEGFAQGMLRQFLEKVGQVEAELAIGSKDNYIYGFKTEKEIDLEQVLPGLASGKLKISLDANNSKINQPVKIESPANYKTYEQILPEIKNGQITQDMLSLKSVAVSLKTEKGNYSEFSCQNSTMSLLCDSIKEASGSNIVIQKNKNFYCAFVKLPSGNYFCIDTPGRDHETPINPTTAGFCTGRTFKCP